MTFQPKRLVVAKRRTPSLYLVSAHCNLEYWPSRRTRKAIAGTGSASNVRVRSVRTVPRVARIFYTVLPGRARFGRRHVHVWAVKPGGARQARGLARRGLVWPNIAAFGHRSTGSAPKPGRTLVAHDAVRGGGGVGTAEAYKTGRAVLAAADRSVGAAVLARPALLAGSNVFAFPAKRDCAAWTGRRDSAALGAVKAQRTGDLCAGFRASGAVKPGLAGPGALLGLFTSATVVSCLALQTRSVVWCPSFVVEGSGGAGAVLKGGCAFRAEIPVGAYLRVHHRQTDRAVKPSRAGVAVIFAGFFLVFSWVALNLDGRTSFAFVAGSAGVLERRRASFGAIVARGAVARHVRAAQATAELPRIAQVAIAFWGDAIVRVVDGGVVGPVGTRNGGSDAGRAVGALVALEAIRGSLGIVAAAPETGAACVVRFRQEGSGANFARIAGGRGGWSGGAVRSGRTYSSSWLVWCGTLWKIYRTGMLGDAAGVKLTIRIKV